MTWFGKKALPVSPPVDVKQNGRVAWVSFIEETCRNNLGEILSYKHPDWESAEKSGDFRTLVTMYAAACTAYEKRADHMFSEWIKCAKLLGINADNTTEFYFMVNRRFSHLAQIRCYFDYQLKLTLVSPDARAEAQPQVAKILSPEMSDSFFPTPASIA